MKGLSAIALLALLALLAVPAGAGELAEGISQRVIGFQAGRGDIKPLTIEGCLASEDFCVVHLTRTLNQSGGNPGLLRQAELAVPVVDGLQFHYQFKPAAGERFCAVELTRPSVVPTFESRSPELSVALSALEVRIDIALPENSDTSWVDGFVILYGAEPGAARACSLTDETTSYQCRGRCEARSF